MKILVVVGGFYPGLNYGGIATSRGNFIHSLGGKNSIYMITTNHDYHSTEIYTNISKGWNDYNNAKILYIDNKNFNNRFFEKIIRKIEPDIIYLSGTITSYFSFNYAILRCAKKHNIPTIITPDGDMCNGAFRMKIIKKIIVAAYCRLFRVYKKSYFQVTHFEEKCNLHKYLGINDNKIIYLPNLPYIHTTIGKKNKVKGILKLIFVSRIHPQKNLDIALRAVIQAKTKVHFDIYGPIENENYWNNCKKIIEKAPDNCEIYYKGALSQDKSRRICEQYDAFILPTQSENYCYSIEEALLCSCPVIISKGTTPWDDVDGVAGYAIQLSDIELFTKKIDLLADKDEEEYSILRKIIFNYIISRLDYEKTCEKYMRFFNWVVENSKNR